MVHRKHRLELNLYKGERIITFTICSKNKTKCFTDKLLIDKLIEILKESLTKYNCNNLAYVFMPDHIHLVIEGCFESSDAWKSIVLFKQKAGFLLKKHNNEWELEKSFFDHIHRKQEDLKKHVFYVLNNPVRKQLIKEWQDYEFKGSLDYNLNEMLFSFL